MARILSIIPYYFYPPVNGGSLRCFNIIKQLAREHQVYVFTVQPKEDFENSNPGFPKNIRVISMHSSQASNPLKGLPSKLVNAIKYRILRKSLRSGTNSYFLEAYPLLVKTLESIDPDIVCYENLEAMGYFHSIIKKSNPRARQVYDAHNVDSELWHQLAIIQKNPALKKYAREALRLEELLYRKVDAIFCCSRADEAILHKLNRGKLLSWVIPNGVDSSLNTFDSDPGKSTRHELLFCGSLDYYPNEEGLLWFYGSIFSLIKKQFSGISLTLVGTSPERESVKLYSEDPSVHIAGFVDDIAPYYHKASICIVPLLRGSGTRLKILEAMSFGNPVVTTAAGAEGLGCHNNEHILIGDSPEAFATHVISLLKGKTQFDRIRNAAREWVKENHDWQYIGDKMNTALNKISNGIEHQVL